MIEIEITQEMIIRATKKSLEMGEIRNSITSGMGNIAGFIGEQVANEVIKGIINNTYDYDIIENNILWDVKTKRCTSRPRPHYECSIAALNTHQICTKYAFVRLEFSNDTWHKAYILGWLDKDEYYKKAKFLKKGDFDPDNNFTVKADCYNVKISDLNPFEV
jgi:hypothetical protein